MITKTSEIDYRKLNDTLTKKAYRLSEVKDKLVSVAWDVVKFPSEDGGANLWQIQSADDGNDYIVSIYEESADTTKKTAETWAVSLSKTASTLDVYYKGDPIVTVATNRLGIPVSELSSVERYLPTKLASNKALVTALLAQLSSAAKHEVLTKYPELA